MTMQWFWWWVGISDPRLPKGEQALGAVIVTATDEATAGLKARAAMGYYYAHTEMFIGQVPPERGDPPPHVVGRMLARKDAEALAQTWPGYGFASPEEIKQAILDDEALQGDPLFRARGKQ